MKRLFALVVCVMSIVSLASMAGAAPFQNGDFQNMNYGSDGCFGRDYNPTGVVGWTAFGRGDQGNPYGVQDYNWSSYQGLPGEPFPNRAILLRWVYAGGIYQAFDTIAGHQYQVDFWMAGELSAGPYAADPTYPIRDINVTAGATSQAFQFDTTGKTSTNMGWALKSMTFVAGGAQSTLKFENTGLEQFCGNAAIIDKVSVTDMGAVPEPASLIALGMGLVGLIARRRK